MAQSPRPHETAAFLLSKVGFDVSQRFREKVAPLGLEPRQVGLIRNIMAAEGQTQQALAEALGIPASRMVALVDELEERGFVERRQNPSDRRARALHLTAKGRRVMRKVAEIGMQHEAEVTAGLEPAEREQLIALLRRIAEAQEHPLEVHPGLAKPWVS